MNTKKSRQEGGQNLHIAIYFNGTNGIHQELPARLKGAAVTKKAREMRLDNAPATWRDIVAVCLLCGYKIYDWPDGVVVTIKPPLSGESLIAAYKIGRLDLEQDYAEGQA